MTATPSAAIIDGKATAAGVREGLEAEIKKLTPAAGRAPGLTVILVGDDPASQVYVRNKEKFAAQIGINGEVRRLGPDTTQAELEANIDDLNADPTCDGILLQLPLPKGLDAQALLERIDPAKDVDGFHPVNMGKLLIGLDGFKPCTPWGVIKLLETYNLSPSGKKAVVIGRSNIVGKPLAVLLGQPGPYGNATVTLAHSRTADLAAECRQADFIFAAVGVEKLVTADMVKPGAVVIDVGMNRNAEGKLCGDVDFGPVSEVAAAITPVPGGVGPMTIAMLLSNTVDSWKRRLGLV